MVETSGEVPDMKSTLEIQVIALDEGHVQGKKGE
jgi:predicted RNA-binding protein YlqC (UPF0109 family)